MRDGFQFTHPGGVRRLSRLILLQTQSFNSRTREGCDFKCKLSFLTIDEFQFTHPGGVRPERLQHESARDMFQFTHPGGVRLGSSGGVEGLPPVSIHAPGRGATLSVLTCKNTSLVSIHAPGRGATAGALVLLMRFTLFQFTHPGGVRRELVDSNVVIPTRFNSRTREGCDKLWLPRVW